jgi:hypothetical protein
LQLRCHQLAELPAVLVDDAHRRNRGTPAQQVAKQGKDEKRRSEEQRECPMVTPELLE